MKKIDSIVAFLVDKMSEGTCFYCDFVWHYREKQKKEFLENIASLIILLGKRKTSFKKAYNASNLVITSLVQSAPNNCDTRETAKLVNRILLDFSKALVSKSISSNRLFRSYMKSDLFQLISEGWDRSGFDNKELEKYGMDTITIVSQSTILDSLKRDIYGSINFAKCLEKLSDNSFFEENGLFSIFSKEEQDKYLLDFIQLKNVKVDVRIEKFLEAVKMKILTKDVEEYVLLIESNYPHRANPSLQFQDSILQLKIRLELVQFDELKGEGLEVIDRKIFVDGQFMFSIGHFANATLKIKDNLVAWITSEQIDNCRHRGAQIRRSVYVWDYRSCNEPTYLTDANTWNSNPVPETIATISDNFVEFRPINSESLVKLEIVS